MSIDGSGARRITNDGEDAQNPSATADGAWIVYWSLVQVSPEMRAVHVEEGRGYGELLGRLLSDLARARRVQADLKQAVVGLTCLLDGLWLKWCLDPESYRPKDAAALCEEWVDRMVDPQPKGFSTR